MQSFKASFAINLTTRSSACVPIFRVQSFKVNVKHRFIAGNSKFHLKFLIAIELYINLKIESVISRERILIFENGLKHTKI